MDNDLDNLEDLDDLDILNSEIFDINNNNLNNKNIDILSSTFLENPSDREEPWEDSLGQPVEPISKDIVVLVSEKTTPLDFSGAKVYNKQETLIKNIDKLVESPNSEIKEEKDIITEQNKNYSRKDEENIDVEIVLDKEKQEKFLKDHKENNVNHSIIEELNINPDKVNISKCDRNQVINTEPYQHGLEEEYLKKGLSETFDKSTVMELNQIEREIQERDIKNRQYLDVRNGEVVYSIEKNPSQKIIKDVKNQLEKAKTKTKKSGNNLINFYNEMIDNSVFRNRVLVVILVVFLISFIVLSISLLREPKIKDNKIDANNQTLTVPIEKKSLNTLTKTKENKTNETIVDDNIVLKEDIETMKNNYLEELYEINEDDIVSCIKNINKKMNRLSLMNRLESNLAKKENNLLIIESNKDIFKSGEEIEVFYTIYNDTRESILLSQSLIELLESSGLNKDKLNTIINQYNVFNK